MFLGKDIKKIPCFRNSYLYGIIGGFTMGLGYFMFTSRTLRATHFGFGSFVVISSGYWYEFAIILWFLNFVYYY